MITGKCNNNCAYCYAIVEGSDLNFRELKKAFSILKNKGVKEVILCGWEPTLRPDFKKIVRELKK
ncbi:MAG: radical SAM protein [Candidatus Diapherotrites archaeon]